ncbi:MAG: hypothetical protein JO132_16890 [Streptosporangiaceae bacterium]|nr:hypothetical protein [Streptosporangiaceae bacterium]
MIRQSATYRIPRLVPPQPGPPAAPAGAGELLAWQCTRCGAVGTHYLTCSTLRLPAGYRLSQDPGADRHAGHRSEQFIAHRASPVPGRRPEAAPGGPDHPDWPLPPQR